LHKISKFRATEFAQSIPKAGITGKIHDENQLWRLGRSFGGRWNCIKFENMHDYPAIAILVAGLPGSGKTYFARRLAGKLGAAYLSSDILRKTLTPHRSYSEAEKQKVYAELESRLSHALRAAQTVVVDATFIQEDLRKRFAETARVANAKSIIIEVKASEETIRERLSHPREDSDADFAVYERLRDLHEPISLPHLVLHSDQMDVEEMIGQTKKWIGGHS
jgi:hypothetical protein